MKELMTRAEYESREENIFFIGVSYENYVINEFGNTVPEQFMTIKTSFENACKYLGIDENGNRISEPCTWETRIFENFIDAENFAGSKEFAVHSLKNRCCVYYIA